MKKIKRKFTMVLLTAFVLLFNITAFAGVWKQDTVGWWYQSDDGSYPKGNWKLIDNTWYYFDASGYMKTGWIQSGNIWYYCNLNGSLATNSWVGEYYVGADGAMLVNGTTPDGFNVDGNGKKINSSSAANETDYSQYIGEYSDIEDYKNADPTSVSMGEAHRLIISKINNGMVYGTYDYGYMYMYDENFESGAKIINNSFSVDGVSEFWEKGDSEPFETATYKATYSFQQKNGQPVIIKSDGIKFYKINGEPR